MNLWDVYIVADDRVLTVVKAVFGETECEAKKNAGAALLARNDGRFLAIGSQLVKFQRIFKRVPSSCNRNTYVKTKVVLHRLGAVN